MRRSRRLVIGGARLAVVLICLGISLLTWRSVSAQEGDTIGWDDGLECPAQHQARPGVRYCISTPEGKPRIHVIGVDLSAPGVRIEYLIPKGNSEVLGEGVICQDSNRPEWGSTQGGGCYVPGRPDLYPVMPLVGETGVSAQTQAQQVFDSPGLAAILNGDYSAPPSAQDHGPEGLVVVQGQRLDGAERCDGDFGAVLRPWLAVGVGLDPGTGLLPATIGNLEHDNDEFPFAVYTGVGGGPWLIQDGKPNPNADACLGTRHLPDGQPPIANCLRERATAVYVEKYGSSCYRTAHTATGISQDGRWLFFVMNEGDGNGDGANDGMVPSEVAEFMLSQLGVDNAIKFDGGGSSQIWVGGTEPQIYQPTGSSRSLPSYLAIYQAQLGAHAVDRVTYITTSEGGTVTLDPSFVNESDFTWTKGGGIAMVERPTIDLFSARGTFHDLPRSIAPGEQVTWEFPITPTGVRVYRYQMAEGEAYFGDETQFLVIVIPKVLEERREAIERKIEKLIEELQAEGEAELEELAERIIQLLWVETQKLAEGALRTAWRWLMAQLQQLWGLLRTCPGSLVLVGLCPCVQRDGSGGGPGRLGGTPKRCWWTCIALDPRTELQEHGNELSEQHVRRSVCHLQARIWGWGSRSQSHLRDRHDRA